MEESLEDAYRLHAAELIRYAAAIVGPDDASDVVVDAMIKVFDRRGPRSDRAGLEHVRAYLFRAVYTGSIDHQRSAQRRRRRETLVGRRDVRPSSQPTESIDAQRALAHLSGQQRSVTFLVYWADHSIAEVAVMLGVTEGTVRKQLDRARKRLAKVLDV